MAYTSAAESAAIIRKRLKTEHGWTSQAVSVTCQNFSLGSSIEVRIKAPDIPLAPVKAIAEDQEHVRRDEAGEILGGGNRYVHVRYSDEAAGVFRARWQPAVAAAFALIEAGSNSLKPVEGTGFLVGRSDVGHVSLWGENHSGCLSPYGSVESVAETIGARMVAAEHAAGKAA